MNFKISKNQIERFSRQVVLKHIGVLGQKKIIQAKVLIVGMGGLGCPVAEFLTRAGVGCLGIIDFDRVALSNIHRQCLYDCNDIGKFKVETAKKKIKKINTKTKVKTYKLKLDEKNITKIIKKYDFIVDGSDNFKTKFLLNDVCIKNKKILVTGAISKFDGHLFTFNFKKKSTPCLRCFFQEEKISDDILNCESEGIIGSVAGTMGAVQANEVLKQILEIGKNLVGFILIIDLLNLDFRKVKLIKLKKCIC